MEPGLYVTFFTRGEPADRELPPVGPLGNVVVRSGSLIADRKGGEQDDAFVGGMRWIEAELELRRATGKEPGGVQHSELRIAAPEGVYLRFVSFGDSAEPDSVPELGPYAVVVIGRRGVEADGDQLATRSAADPAQWELTGVGGSAFVGIVRSDIAFRTRSTTYHPDVNGFRAAAPAPAPAPVPAAARPAQPTPPEDPGLALRNRIGSDPRPVAKTVAEEESREWGGAAWQMRYVIIGALVALIIAFSIPSITSLFSSVGPGAKVVGVGTTVTSPDWTYSVGRVRRAPTIGAARANGTYLIVQVTATNRARPGAQLAPNSFLLRAATGEQYPPLSATSSVYSSAENPDSVFLWPAEFPVGRPMVVPVIFEVNPAIDSTQLVIVDVPSTRVRLE